MQLDRLWLRPVYEVTFPRGICILNKTPEEAIFWFPNLPDGKKYSRLFNLLIPSLEIQAYVVQDGLWESIF